VSQLSSNVVPHPIRDGQRETCSADGAEVRRDWPPNSHVYATCERGHRWIRTAIEDGRQTFGGTGWRLIAEPKREPHHPAVCPLPGQDNCPDCAE
jgi:hypothetical protein